MNHKNSYKISKNFPGFEPYVYFLQHIPSGIWYIGSKYSANANPAHFMVNYFTSSDIMHGLMDISNAADFKYKILKIFVTAKEATIYENRLLVKMKAVNNRMSANRDDNQSPADVIHVKYKTRMISNPATGKCIRVKKEMPLPDGFVEGNINAGNPKSAGRKWFHDPITYEMFHLLKDQEPEPHWVRGRGPNYKSNSETLKGKNLRSITNGTENRQISSDESLPDGWHYGRTKSDNERKNNAASNSTRTGLKYYTNGIDVKQFKPEDVPNGWKQGNPKQNSVKGKLQINNGIVRRYINPGEQIPEGFKLGGMPRKISS